jgi:monooxygenase
MSYKSEVVHFDVIVIGAGLSGIGAGYHLKKYCPNKTFVILEGRSSIGGTWDLFRYPGIRSDSSMETMVCPMYLYY